MEIREYKSGDKAGLIRLWAACELVNPKNDPEKDIDRKLASGSGWIFIGVEDGEIVASAMVGYEGHRGWINYLAVSPGYRKIGFGRQIMDKSEMALWEIGCPKINLQVREGNASVLEFYANLGFVEDAAISMGKRLVDDSDRIK
jgi:ribosomal protein S18 acetylase RimI-like enzyme